MSQLARVVDEETGEVALVALEGEIDASTARDVAQRLRGALSNRSLALVVDLDATTYIDSAGINALFALDVELRQRRQQLHLVIRPGSAVARVAAIVGLDRTVATHATRDAAHAAAATPD
jgi:anti-anti-sigma factor